jgi:hypothetical protein
MSNPGWESDRLIIHCFNHFPEIYILRISYLLCSKSLVNKNLGNICNRDILVRTVA